MNNHDRSISVSLILDFCDMAEAPARSAEDELRFEFDFRSKLAELQRKYKEKQRELSQLRESNRTFFLSVFHCRVPKRVPPTTSNTSLHGLHHRCCYPPFKITFPFIIK